MFLRGLDIKEIVTSAAVLGWNKREPVATTRKCNEQGDYMTGTSNIFFLDNSYTFHHFSDPGSLGSFWGDSFIHDRTWIKQWLPMRNQQKSLVSWIQNSTFAKFLQLLLLTIPVLSTDFLVNLNFEELSVFWINEKDSMTEKILSDVKVWHLITRRLNCNEGELSVTLGHQPGAKLQNTTFCLFFLSDELVYKQASCFAVFKPFTVF